MRTLITGASGLVGAAVAQRLRQRGHEVICLRYRSGSASAQDWSWDPVSGYVDPRVREGVEAVVHLGGENIADRRWTTTRKQRIRESRVNGTRLLAETLAQSLVRPRVVVSASATGYYGHREATPVTEEAEPGRGFLSEVCQAWEAAWQPLEAKGVRVVRLRIGMVLAAHGGALARMLPLFRWGLGGTLGSGQQFWSWIHLEDLVRVAIQTMAEERLAGPVNAVAPEALTQAEFTRILARVLHRPAWLPTPAFLLRGALGEMAEAVLLSGARVVPQKLVESGFQFEHPRLEGALADLLPEPGAARVPG